MMDQIQLPQSLFSFRDVLWYGIQLLRVLFSTFLMTS